jgi:hypothetical protein
MIFTLPGIRRPAGQRRHRARPGRVAADFAAMMAGSMGKRVADVLLRIWTPQYASMFLKQVALAVEHLTSRRTESGPQVGDYPTGAGALERAAIIIWVSRSPTLAR